MCVKSVELKFKLNGSLFLLNSKPTYEPKNMLRSQWSAAQLLAQPLCVQEIRVEILAGPLLEFKLILSLQE